MSESEEKKSKLIVETTFTLKASTHFQCALSSYRLIGRGLLTEYTVACFLYLKFRFRSKIWWPDVARQFYIIFFRYIEKLMF